MREEDKIKKAFFSALEMQSSEPLNGKPIT